MNGNKPILLVEDDRFDVITIQRALRDVKVLNPLEVAWNGEEALKVLRDPEKPRPCVILLDINMPRMNGIEALRQIKGARPEIKVIMLTVSEDEGNLVEAIRSGADGYLLKHLNAREFLEMVNGLEHGEAAITRQMTMRLIKHMTSFEPVGDHVLLSEREIEILKLVASGKSNQAIADQLSISENTVKYHLKNILQKLGVSNRTEAVTIAMQRGLL